MAISSAMLGHLTNFKHKDFFLEITLFDSSVMIVDKTRIGKDVHGNNDNIDITNLVLHPML